MSRVTEQVEIREACREEYEAIGDLIVSAYIGYPEVAEDPDYIEELRDVATRAAVRPVLVAVDETGTVLGSATYISGPGPFAARAAALPPAGAASARRSRARASTALEPTAGRGSSSSHCRR